MNKLSNREKEIMEHVAIGKPTKEIAKDLFLSSSTVRNHLANVFNKISVNNRVQATLWYLKNKEGENNNAINN